MPRRTGVYARTVGSLVPRLTQKAFEKFGFSTAQLLTDWGKIVGAELASYSQPERLKWPRNEEADEAAKQRQRQGRTGATLMLRVDGPRALEVQYRESQLIDRINAYFGYHAVGEIRIIQAPIKVSKPAATAGRAPGREKRSEPPAAPMITGVGDDRLQAALMQMQGEVGRTSRSPRR
jgi:hypothetical protein